MLAIIGGLVMIITLITGVFSVIEKYENWRDRSKANKNDKVQD